MAKYRLRPHHTFLDSKNRPTRLDIVDDDHPCFARQKHKFESEPVSAKELKAKEQEDQDELMAYDGEKLKGMDRPELVELWQRIFPNAQLPEDASATMIRDDLLATKAEMEADED